MKTVKIKASSEKRWEGEGKNKRRETKKKIMGRRKNIQSGKKNRSANEEVGGEKMGKE